MTIPVHRCPLPVSGSLTYTNNMSILSSTNKPSEPRPFQILLVEDEEALVDVLTRVLRDAGFIVTTAVDGERGKVETDRIAFDVIITDLNMPKVRGEKFIGMMRSATLNKNTPVIVISGHLSPGAVKDLKKNVFRIMVKPFKAEDLVEAVKALQQRKRPSARSA